MIAPARQVAVVLTGWQGAYRCRRPVLHFPRMMLNHASCGRSHDAMARHVTDHADCRPSNNLCANVGQRGQKHHSHSTMTLTCSFPEEP